MHTKISKKKDLSRYNKNTREWEEENLEEEIEEIFHPAIDDFTLADLVGRTDVANPHVDEKDFELHKRESLQYHQPLHRLYHHKHKKSHRSERNEEEKPVESHHMSTVCEEPVLDPSNEKVEPCENEPLLNLKDVKSVPSGVQKTADSKDKVQFYVGSSTSLENAASLSSKFPLKSVLRPFLNQTGAPSSHLSPPFPSPSNLKRSSEGALSSAVVDSSYEKTDSGLRNTPSSEKEKAKVTFLLGEESQSDLQKDLQKNISESVKSSRTKHARRLSSKRKHHGFDIDAKKYNTVLDPEEAATLQSADIDDMASHRFEDPKGMHRSKIRGKFWGTLFKKEDSTVGFYKDKYDHTPHKLFVELHELKSNENADGLQWRQVARWIKYEEDVELGPDRWGKPHVPPLCFDSVVRLRNFIEAGSVMLDLEENDLTGIITRIVDAMVQDDQLQTNLRDKVLKTLLLRHRHVNEKHLPLLRRNSGYGNLNLLGHDKRRSPLFSKAMRSKSLTDANHILNNGESATPAETAILMDGHEMNAIEVMPAAKRKSFSTDKEKTPDPLILKRIPQNAEGVAVLVGQMPELDKPACTFVRLAEGKLIEHFLEIPIEVRFIYVLLGPEITDVNYHELGRVLGSLMSNEAFCINMYQATCMKDILRGITFFMSSCLVLPAGSWDNSTLLPVDEIRRKSLSAFKRVKAPPRKLSYDPLQRSNKPFGGFIKDIKHRYPFYKTDVLEGLNFQCVASVIFIYFAAVSGAIAFGGLLSDKTEMNIGVSETLIGTAVCGIMFSLLSGQPLIIIGTTGPLLMFDEMLFQAKQMQYYSSPFLVMRVWVGIWTAIIATIVVACEGSVLVKYFSRFVQEIFATIISLLFIYESFIKLYKIFAENPLLTYYCSLNDSLTNSSNSSAEVFSSQTHPHPNTALLSAILMIGTFYIAFFLRHFRNSKFLGRSARRALGDFGVPIAIVIMVVLDYFIPNTYTQKLSVPEGLSPSTDRSWIISPVPIPVWEAFVAMFGGLLIFILLFMETQICELIISKKQLRKGSGFHIDLIMVGFMEMISGFIGGPWQCAATVRSISHVSSLIVWSKTHAPGELPHIIEVKEQRLTNFLVSTLVGLSVLMAPVLRQVPLAVLFGVFLYMGISALSGIHLYERFLLIFMPVKHHPDFPFVRKVRTSKMHLYTSIQVVCIGALWLLKTYFSPGFPFLLLSMVGVHKSIKELKLFTEEEIAALDGEGSEDKKDNEDDPDFYEQIVA